MARTTAEFIEAGAVAAIPAKVESLVGGAERFVRDRLEASSAIMGVVRNEQELVESLLRINAANRSIAQEIRMLSVLTSIEVARMGESASGFQYLLDTLQSASERVAESTSEFAERARERARAIEDTQCKMAKALPRLRKQLYGIGLQLQQALGDVKVSVGELSFCPAQFRTCVEMVAAKISGVVCAIQFHDITRQQSEHVREALDKSAARLTANGGEVSAGEISVALRVQVQQLDNIKRTMERWSLEIDECLESILNVSESSLERIAPLVLLQEKQLLARLVEIEEVEKQCENDSAEIAEAFSGLAGLLQMVEEHDGVARMTRDRLQILSFNSIIEARNLGGKADVMLELSRNITRVATDWGRMAERSGSTRAEIQRLMDEAHAGMAALGQEKDRELQNARLDITGALTDLGTAAQSTAANAAEIGELIAALGEQIEAARGISNSLTGIGKRIGRVMNELEALGLWSMASEAENECDLAALEADLSRSYTTEIERNVLRAALYGESLPALTSAVSGNDVELF